MRDSWNFAEQSVLCDREDAFHLPREQYVPRAVALRIVFDEVGKHDRISYDIHRTFVEKMWINRFETKNWAVSSFGRALPWHGRGEEFDSPTVHLIQSA